MKRVTLTIAVVLLAVPAVAAGKSGIEFDNAIEQEQAGTRQGFSVMVMREPRSPYGEPKPVAGIRPVVRFRSADTGALIRGRVGATGADGIARGSVVFPRRGTWSVELRTPGANVGIHPQEFTTGTPASVVETVNPPPQRPAATAHGSSDWWAWLLALPAAGLFALGLRALRRRPRPA